MTDRDIEGNMGQGLRTITRIVAGLCALWCAQTPAWAQSPSVEPAAVRIGTAPLVSPQDALTYFNSLGTVSTADSFNLPDSDFQGTVATYGKDPAALAAFVRDNMDMVWAYGLGRGAHGTLIDRAGTAFDQAQLLVELLKAAGNTSAQYQLGRLTLTGPQFQAWTGITSAKAACQLLSSGGIPASINGETKADCAYAGTVSQVVMSHVWVQATVNGQQVIYDPSVKTYAKSGTESVATKAGYVAGSALTAATGGMESGTASGVPYVRDLKGATLDSALDARASALLAHIDGTLLKDNAPAGRLADLVNEAEIQPGGTAGDPAHGNVDATWVTIPDAYRTKLKVEFYHTRLDGNAYQNVLMIQKDLFADRIAAHKLVLDTNFGGKSSQDDALKNYEVSLRLRGEDIDDIDLAQARLEGSDPHSGRRGLVVMAADHPYAANGGAYMDAKVDKPVMLLVPLTIVQGWGQVGPELAARWGSRPDQVLPPSYLAHRGCDIIVNEEPRCGFFRDTAGDGRREQLAIAWLTQSGTAAKLHATLADSHFVQHHSLGVVAADSEYSGRYSNPHNPQSTIIITMGNSFDRIDVDSGISLTSRTADAVVRRGALLAIAHTLETLEGHTPVQVADVPDSASATTRLAWGNRPPIGGGNDAALNEDPFNNAGPRRFYAYDSSNAAQAASLTLVEGKIALPSDAPHLGNGVIPLQPATDDDVKGNLVDAISTYTAAGYQVVTSAESFLGPGARVGTITKSGDVFSHLASQARGGALIATKYEDGEPIAIAHVTVNKALVGQRTMGPSINVPHHVMAKGGGANIQTYHKAQYDPSTAADVLKAKFVDRSSERGVDLKSGHLTYQSPVSLSIGSGKFPYQLSGSLIWRGGSAKSAFLPPSPLTEPQSPLTTNWASMASMSSSITELMGAGDLRATAGTVVAFLAMQDIYREQPGVKREAAAVLAASWWLRQGTGNVVTVNVGASTQQFIRLADGQWVSPGGGQAKLAVNGARVPYLEDGCVTGGQPVQQGRGWNYAGMSFQVTSPAGDVQTFQHSRTVNDSDLNACYVSQGFRLTDWSFPQGVQISLTYAHPGNSDNEPEELVSVSNNLGRQLKFTRSGLSGIDNGLTGTDRRTLADIDFYQLDYGIVREQYRLNAVRRPIAPNTPYIRWTYDALGRVASIEDAQAVADQPSREGRTCYDPTKAADAQVHRHAWCFAYAAGLGGVRVDPLGGRYAAQYDTDGHLRKVVDELGRVTTLTPDGRGRVVEYLYPMGEKQRLTYDARNNPTSLTRAARPGSTLASTTVKAEWDATWNKPKRVTDARGGVTDLTYNPTTGLLTKLEQPAVTPSGETAPRRPTTSFTYDEFGRLKAASDPSGMVTRYDYSAVNETLTTQVVDDGRLNLTTGFTYNIHGDLTEVTTPRGAKVSAGYNARRQPLYEETRAGLTAVSPQTAQTILSRTEWVYDDVGRVREEKRSSDMPGVPYAVTATLYTATDQPRSVTDPLGRVTVTDYDPLDRAIRVTTPWETGRTRVSEIVYDIAGRKAQECTAGHKDTLCTAWDEATRAANAAEADSILTTYAYYDDDQVRTITDPRGNVLAHAYDGFGRLSILSYPDGKAESYAYDVNDNRTGFTQRDGTVSTTAYDALNRPTSITRPGLAVTSYGLDILGRVVAEKAGAATLRTHVYDTAGRKLSANVTLPRPPTGVTGSAPTVGMTFDYDKDGNRISATWSGATVGWRYDGLKRVTGVDLGTDAVTRHGYDLLGRRTATVRGAASSAYTYDIAGQLKGLNHAWTGGSLTASYGYDDAGALVSEALDNAAFRWEPAPTLARTTSYDPASPINALTKVDGVLQTHDGRGNRTGAAGRTWRYDSRNMLTGANAPGMAATYGYYPEGGRAWKQVNGVTTLYLELDGIEWGTYAAAGTLTERTIRASGAGGAVVAVQSATGGLIRLLPNRQGSVIGWLRPDGKLGGAYTYDAYGNSAQAGAGGPQFRYAGMRFDAETGLYHTPNRAYDPQDGRWMQLDPIGIKDGLNRYAYVANDPTDKTDPLGLYDCSGNKSDCAAIDKFVQTISKSLAGLNPKSDAYAKVSAVASYLGKAGDKNGVTLNSASLAKGTFAHADKGGEIKVDVGQISKSQYSAKNNAGWSGSDITNAIGAGAVAHEARHERDFQRLWGGNKPSNKAEEMRTELNAFRTTAGVWEGIGFRTGLWYQGISPEQQDQAISDAAKQSTEAWCNAGGGCQ